MGKRLRFCELRHVRLGFTLLLVVAVENRGAILRAVVGPLTVQLRGVVGHREEDLHQLAVRDLRRIEYDLHGLGVSRTATADFFVRGRRRASSSVAGRHAKDALHAFEYGFDAPEAAARKNGDLLVLDRGRGMKCEKQRENGGHLNAKSGMVV